MELYLTVVKRAEDQDTFLEQLNKHLQDNYVIHGVHSLDEFYDTDGKDRYLAFVEEEIIPDVSSTAENLVQILRGDGFAAYIHDTPDEAIEFAKGKYGFEDSNAIRQEKMNKVREEFPHFTAEEWESFHIFDSFYHTGKVQAVRGKYNEELVMVLASIVNGIDEVRVTPLAILVNDYMIKELELPFENLEEDEE